MIIIDVRGACKEPGYIAMREPRSVHSNIDLLSVSVNGSPHLNSCRKVDCSLSRCAWISSPCLYYNVIGLRRRFGCNCMFSFLYVVLSLVWTLKTIKYSRLSSSVSANMGCVTKFCTVADLSLRSESPIAYVPLLNPHQGGVSLRQTVTARSA